MTYISISESDYFSVFLLKEIKSIKENRFEGKQQQHIDKYINDFNGEA